jgi:hypothetical protein
MLTGATMTAPSYNKLPTRHAVDVMGMDECPNLK